MKTIILISWLLTSVMVANGQTTGLKRLQQDNGFGQYKLGMRMKSIPDLTCVQGSFNHSQECILKNNVVLKLGDTNLQVNKLVSFKRRLTRISLKFDLVDSSNVVRSLTYLYGQPMKGTYVNSDSSNVYYLIWNGGKVSLKVMKDEIIFSRMFIERVPLQRK